MKVKKAKWLVFLMVVAMLMSQVPAVGGAEAVYDDYLAWTGQGTDSMNCEEYEQGTMHWVLTQAGDVTDPVLVLSNKEGIELERVGYSKMSGPVYHFETGYYDLDNLVAKVWFNGTLAQNRQAKITSQFVLSGYCPGPDIVRFPVDGTAYIGYEDRLTGSDFDYNDFGMNMELEEVYVSGVLESISMKFTSVINRAGDRHDIHIGRPLNGDYTYTITRSEAPYSSREVEAVTDASGSGNFDVVLFDTERWPNSDTQVMGQWVEIEITMADGNVQNLLTDYSAAPRWDLDEVFSLYNPYMFNRNTSQNINLNSSDTFRGIPNVPLIIVVPYTDWPAPAESQAIDLKYPDFTLYYSTMGAEGEGWYIP